MQTVPTGGPQGGEGVSAAVMFFSVSHQRKERLLGCYAATCGMNSLYFSTWEPRAYGNIMSPLGDRRATWSPAWCKDTPSWQFPASMSPRFNRFLTGSHMSPASVRSESKFGTVGGSSPRRRGGGMLNAFFPPKTPMSLRTHTGVQPQIEAPRGEKMKFLGVPVELVVG